MADRKYENLDNDYGTASPSSVPQSLKTIDGDDGNPDSSLSVRDSSLNEHPRKDFQPSDEDRLNPTRASRASERERVYADESEEDASAEDPDSPRIHYPTKPEEIEGGNTSMKLTVLLLINNVIGGGILALPQAFHQTSLILGVILLLFTTLTTMMNLVFIVEAAQKANEFRYAVLVNENLHPYFAKLLLLSLILWPAGTVTAYAQISSEAMPPVLRSFGISEENFSTSHTCWLIISGVIFFAVSCRRHLSDLLIPSLLGLVAIAFSGLGIMIRCFDGSYGPEGRFAPANYTTTNAGIEPIYFKPVLFSSAPLFAFALNVHSNAPHYYQSLRLKNGKRSPRKMYKAIIYSHAVITLLYIIFGVLGVVTFQNDSDRMNAMKGDILNGYSFEDTLMNVVRIFYFLVILVSYPILQMATRKGINQMFFGTKELSFAFLAFETFAIVVLSCLIAAFIPSLNETLAVLGSLVGVTVMFVGPSYLYLKICCWENEEDQGEFTWHKAGAYYSIIFGIAVPGILGLLATFVQF